ncbi:ABC transporter [Thozetella sp. PMI_491]|nr:ABC transporter [Thozetella sp. PMI_491]
MCTPADDDVFGPIVGPNCREGFDFTLLFEQSIFSLLPAAIFLLLAIPRLIYLIRSNETTRPNPLRTTKALAASAFLAWQLVVLFLSTHNTEDTGTQLSVALAAVHVAVALQFLLLSWLEDARSVRPSTLLCVYLVLTLLLDIPQLRTLWLLRREAGRLGTAFSITFAIKAVLLVLEAQQKRKYLKSAYSQLPPESTTGIIGHSFLWWINSLIWRGSRPPPISIDDLYDLDPGLSSELLGRQLQVEWDKRQTPERKLELVVAVGRALWWPMVKSAFPRLFVVAFTFAQPFLIENILSLLVLPEEKNTYAKGQALIAATAIIYVGLAVATLHYNQAMNRVEVKTRGAIVGLIYSRALRIQDGVYDDSAAVTLMTSDVDLIVSSLSYLHNVWARALELAVGVYLLSRKIGWVCIIPILIVFFSTIMSAGLAIHIGDHIKKWNAAIQKRVGVTGSVLGAMRSVKISGLGMLIMDTLQDLRVRETDAMASFRWDMVWQNVWSNFTPAATPAFTFAVYAIHAALQGNFSAIDTAQAFTSLALMRLVTLPAVDLMVAIPLTVASLGSFDRIQEFLIAPSRQDQRADISRESISTGSNVSKHVTSNGSVAPEETQPNGNPTSIEIAVSVSSLDVRPGKAAETVLHDISFQLPQGSFTVILGPVAAGKSTLLKALLGEVSFEKGTVGLSDDRIAYCAQTPWLPNTTIRHAICGVNREFDEEWYMTCLQACALSHDLSLFPDGDGTKIGSAGMTLSGGQKHRVALARALYGRPRIAVLDDMLSALDTKTKKSVVESLFSDGGLFRKLGSTVVLVTHATECLPFADKILVLSQGKLDYNGTYNEAAITGVIDRVLPTLQQDEEETEAGKRFNNESPQDSNSTKIKDLTRQTGDFGVYKYYFRYIGWPKASVLLIAVLAQVFFDNFLRIWLKWWSDAGGGQLSLYLSVYVTIPFLNCVAIGVFIWSFLVLISPSSSNEMHYTLLKTVMRAPQSFFSSTPTGEILNMFSQDMGLIEGTLAVSAAIFVSTSLRSIAQLGVIITASPYLSLTTPLLLLAVYALQHIYLRTSRQMRYLDLEAKSPLYSHWLETLTGITTIRAFGWQQANQLENHSRLDVSQRPYYLLLTCQKWLVLVLSLMVSSQTIILVGLSLSLRQTTDPGFVGVSLTSVMGLDVLLQAVVTGWTDLEIALGSVARIKNLERDVRPEDKEDETYKPPTAWPEKGEIEFRGVTASHNPETVALRELSFIIAPGQKFGVCGRTGSGKSSLVGTLLRVLEIDQGSIFVDGLDLSIIPRDTIRSRIITLPQDPLILAASVRLNVDPLAIATDGAIIDVLTRVGLWTGVLEEREGGLDAELTDADLSVGQQQLLALARALLRVRQGGQKILVLDEPTSNVDPETDRTIQRVLGEECSECTTVTVAHRMDTIRGSDVVAVMEEGKVVEFGKPQELLTQNGKFAKLVNG